MWRVFGKASSPGSRNAPPEGFTKALIHLRFSSCCVRYRARKNRVHFSERCFFFCLAHRSGRKTGSTFPHDALWCGHVSECLMSSSLTFPRAVLVAGLLVLALAACGRRGALEPPPDASAQADTQMQTPMSDSTLPSPVGTPRSSARQGYTIPNKPFILDPLL
jgi:predicted small lipoprotein YifL